MKKPVNLAYSTLHIIMSIVNSNLFNNIRIHAQWYKGMGKKIGQRPTALTAPLLV